jgi:hypothetical protein
MGVVAGLTGQVSLMGLMGIRNDFPCHFRNLIVTTVAAHAYFGGNLFLGRGLLVALVAGYAKAFVLVGQKKPQFSPSQRGQPEQHDSDQKGEKNMRCNFNPFHFFPLFLPDVCLDRLNLFETFQNNLILKRASLSEERLAISLSNPGHYPESRPPGFCWIW